MNNKSKRGVPMQDGIESGPLELIEAVEYLDADIVTEAPYTGCTERVKGVGSYYDLLESIPEVIFILTPEGVISYLTPAFCELTGWEREQWIGRPFSELVDIEMRKDTLRNLFKLENCPLKKSFETKILVRSGGSISADVSAKSRFMNGRVTGITGLLRDNRDKKRSQEVHALQEKRIRSLYEISAEPGMGIEAQLEEALRVGADMLSMEVAGIGQVSGRSCTVLYCHDELGRFKQGFEFDMSKTYCKITLAKDEVVAFDHVAESEYRNDESYRSFGFESYIAVPLRINGMVFGTLNFASHRPRKEPFTKEDKDFIRLMGRWISTMIERKKAEDMLREKEQLYRTLVENAHDLIVEITYEGKFLYVSANHKEVIGYEPEELLGRNVFELMHPDDRASILSEFIQVLRTNSTARVVYRYRHKNGEWQWFESTGKPYRTSSGEIRAIVDTREITERKKNEERIQRSLDEKESLLREIHHRVKNNLQVVSSLLGLQSDYAKDKESLSLFYESQNRISAIALIHEKLYRSSNLSEVKMLDYITDLTRNLLGIYDGAGRSIDVQINAYDISVNIDIAIPCGLIINELFANCVKHAFNDKSGDGKGYGSKARITVELYSEENSNLVLTVKDNGVGFPASLDFRNTNTLGLQLVCALTEQLNGTIELESGNGTRFYIVFPASGRKNVTP